MRIELYGLPQGDDGIDATVEKMMELIREGTKTKMFRSLARSKFTLKDMFRYAQRGIRYEKDPKDAEMLRRADYTVVFGKGDCDDKTIVLATMIKSKYPKAKINIVVGACRKGSNDFSHVWLEVYLPKLKRYVPMDATPLWSKIGWQPECSRIKKYPLT